MVQGKHRVGLATSEVGLKLDYRVAVIVGEALYAVDQEPPQAVGQKGAAEELDGILVFGDPSPPSRPARGQPRTQPVDTVRRLRPDEDLLPPARVAAHPSLGRPPPDWWYDVSGSGLAR